MPDKKSVADYSEKELRQLLENKLRSKRKERLKRFRHTGRAVILVPDSESNELTDFHSELVVDQNQHEKFHEAQKLKSYPHFPAVVLIRLRPIYGCWKTGIAWSFGYRPKKVCTVLS